MTRLTLLLCLNLAGCETKISSSRGESNVEASPTPAAVAKTSIEVLSAKGSTQTQAERVVLGKDDLASGKLVFGSRDVPAGATTAEVSITERLGSSERCFDATTSAFASCPRLNSVSVQPDDGWTLNLPEMALSDDAVYSVTIRILESEGGELATASLEFSWSSDPTGPTPEPTATATATATPSATPTAELVEAELVSLDVVPPTFILSTNGTCQLAVSGTFSDGAIRDVTSDATWSSSAGAIEMSGATSGLALARSAGATVVTATIGSVTDTSVATVNPANLIVQWGGWQKSGFGRYDSSGALLSTIVSDALARDLRGMLAVAGGIISVGYDPNASTMISEFVPYAPANGATPIVLEQGAWEAVPQGVSKTQDGFILVPQASTSVVNVYEADGNYVTSFGSGALNGPYRAVELADGSVVVSNWGGKLVKFSHVGSSFTLVGDFATGFTNPFGIDYCKSQDRILMSDYTARKVYSCTSGGTCTVLADHGLTEPRGIRVDENAGDCSFFLGWRDGGASRDKIARFNADGTADNASWATMPAGFARVFAMDYEITP